MAREEEGVRYLRSRGCGRTTSSASDGEGKAVAVVQVFVFRRMRAPAINLLRTKSRREIFVTETGSVELLSSRVREGAPSGPRIPRPDWPRRPHEMGMERQSELQIGSSPIAQRICHTLRPCDD
jgi:hypothetical protein